MLSLSYHYKPPPPHYYKMIQVWCLCSVMEDEWTTSDTKTMRTGGKSGSGVACAERQSNTKRGSEMISWDFNQVFLSRNASHHITSHQLFLFLLLSRTHGAWDKSLASVAAILVTKQRLYYVLEINRGVFFLFNNSKWGQWQSPRRWDENAHPAQLQYIFSCTYTLWWRHQFIKRSDVCSVLVSNIDLIQSVKIVVFHLVSPTRKDLKP